MTTNAPYNKILTSHIYNLYESILLEKHARSFTKKLYDVTLGNLLGCNKKFFYRSTLTYQQFLFTLWKAAIFVLRPVRRRTALISRPECLKPGAHDAILVGR